MSADKSMASLGERRLYIGEVKSVNRESRSFEGWASVEELDRYNEVIRAESFTKWLPRFMSNPVMLWAHDHSIPAVGHFESVEIVPGKGLKFRGVFAETELGEQLLSLYEGGHLRAVSVGFIPHEGHQPNEEELRKWPGAKFVFDEAELLEISPVNVPACAGALVGKSASALTDRSLDDLMDLLRSIKASDDEEQDEENGKRPVSFREAVDELKGIEGICAQLDGRIKSLRATLEAQETEPEAEAEEDQEAAGAAFEGFRKAMEDLKAALS